MDEGLQTILKFIADYGVTILIAGVFMYTAIRVINIFLKRWEGNQGNKKHDELIDMRSEVSGRIQGLIEQFLADSHGNRVQVIEFSNSVVSVAYLPFKYMTCTYEVHKYGKAAMGHRIDRISTSLFTPFFANLQSNPYCTFDIDDKTTLVGGAMCDLMKAQQEHHALCVSLSTTRGKAIGYIQLTKDEEFTQDDIEGIQSLAEQVSALLSVVDK